MSTQFGKYEIVRRIGVGGMGEVYVARVRGAEGFVKDVVIKRILPAFTQDEHFVGMFIQEARLAARLRHANIVQILDFDQVDGEYFIAMEWVDGPDLRRVQQASRRRSIPIPPRLAVHVGVETLKGLHYAHTKVEGGRDLGIVHRDISPHNLLVSFAGEVKIADFGVAKVAALASSVGQTGLKGKLTYMAPEQLSGRGVDRRCDLFALGVLLWELLSGRRAYDEQKSEGELIAAVQQGRIPALAEVCPQVDEPLREIVERLICVDIERRYQDAAEALTDLSQMSRAGDSLALGALLKRLVPEEAEREAKGQTVAAERAFPRRAAANDPTVTRAAGDQSALPHDRAPERLPAVEEVAPRMAAAKGVLRHRAAQVTSRRALTVGFGGLCLVLAWAVVWWSATRSPEQPNGHNLRPVMLTLQNSTPPAQITVDGVPLGRSAARQIWAPAGTSLHVVGTRRQQHVERTVQLTASEPAQRLDLGLLPDWDPPFNSTAQQKVPAETVTARGSSATGPDGAAASVSEKRVSVVTIRRGTKRPRRRRRGSSQRAEAIATGVSKRGVLSIIVWPWAIVELDGKPVGSTPVVDFELSAGKHVVMLRNDELGQRETVHVKLAAGERKKLRRDWLSSSRSTATP